MGPLFLVIPNFRPKIFSKFFHLQSAQVCEFFRGGVWAPPIFGHAKFEVKNFSEFFYLQSALDSEFFTGRVWAPTFFGDANFEVKFVSDFPLSSGLD